MGTIMTVHLRKEFPTTRPEKTANGVATGMATDLFVTVSSRHEKDVVWKGLHELCTNVYELDLRGNPDQYAATVMYTDSFASALMRVTAMLETLPIESVRFAHGVVVPVRPSRFPAGTTYR